MINSTSKYRLHLDLIICLFLIFTIFFNGCATVDLWEYEKSESYGLGCQSKSCDKNKDTCLFDVEYMPEEIFKADSIYLSNDNLSIYIPFQTDSQNKLLEVKLSQYDSSRLISLISKLYKNRKLSISAYVSYRTGLEDETNMHFQLDIYGNSPCQTILVNDCIDKKLKCGAVQIHNDYDYSSLKASPIFNDPMRSFNITFSRTKQIGRYHNSLPVRAMFTPLTVPVDIVTTPFLLCAIKLGGLPR